MCSVRALTTVRLQPHPCPVFKRHLVKATYTSCSSHLSLPLVSLPHTQPIILMKFAIYHIVTVSLVLCASQVAVLIIVVTVFSKEQQLSQNLAIAVTALGKWCAAHDRFLLQFSFISLGGPDNPVSKRQLTLCHSCCMENTRTMTTAHQMFGYSAGIALKMKEDFKKMQVLEKKAWEH